MGAKKEGRDKAHFRAACDDETARTRLVVVDRRYLQRVEDDLTLHRAAAAQLQHDITRATARLRERAATLTVERGQWAEERTGLLQRAHAAEHAMCSFRRRWEYVSRLLRQFPASQVRALREEMSNA